VNSNAPELWDRIWEDPREAEWRALALAAVYDRIAELVPDGAAVFDLGGGVGTLARKLRAQGNRTIVVDHSREACKQAPESTCVDLTGPWSDPGFDRSGLFDTYPCDLLVSTETVEHLPLSARVRIYQAGWLRGGLLVSVPHDRLGPEDESQHTVRWTALEFLEELREHFPRTGVRVEVVDGFLLGVCGGLAEKSYRLSVCTPARDEAEDLARTLASFRGVADEIVVGIDPRTTDESRAVAERFAEVVFELDEPRGPPDDRAPKVHMAWIRNQCLDRCTGDWIFMTEAHESLKSGQDELRGLDQLSEGAKVAFVMRTGDGQRWGFPWLHRNLPTIRYKRATHNVLDFPTSHLCVRLPQIETLHHRRHETIERRKEQRRVQNRVSLTEDWTQRGNENSLLYLGSEWSEYDKDRAIARLREYLAVNRSSGAARYHARLQCAKLLAQQGDADEARAVLIGATAEDWSRIDHWFYLGDLALEAERYEEALQFYRYAATRIDDPPFCVWWIDLGIYGYLTAQRLTECHAALGNFDDALHWAERAIELMPDDTPDEALEEARTNVQRITEAICPAN
jgi:hypothetical protein